MGSKSGETLKLFKAYENLALDVVQGHVKLRLPNQMFINVLYITKELKF